MRERERERERESVCVCVADEFSFVHLEFEKAVDHLGKDFQ